MTSQSDIGDRTKVADAGKKAPEGLTAQAAQKVAETRLAVDSAVESAREEIGRHRNVVVRESKIRGRAGEILAHEGHPGTLDLNDVCTNNFPVYDLVGRRGFISVKTRVDRPDGSPPVESYAHDLRVAGGLTRRPEYGKYAGMTGVDIAAQRLQQMKENAPKAWDHVSRHVPDHSRAATTYAELATAMQKDFRLAIPDDHVKSAREYIERVAQLHPQLYGLPENLSESDLIFRARELSRRIVPARIGISSKMIADRIDAQTKRHRH